jgi:hypothetical protein
MKRIILSTIALLTLFSAPLARAWSYNTGDLLLIFRESGYTNIEFDLGSVSNLLGHSTGFTTNLTGWSSSLVTDNFGSDLTGVSVILAAVDSPTNTVPTAWLSSADPNPGAYNVNQATWVSALYETIDYIGAKPEVPFKVPLPPGITPTNAYAISPTSAQYGGASYDSIVSGGRLQNVPIWDGSAPFGSIPVEQVIPGSFDFWQVQDSYGAPNHLVGTFTVAANGTLTFVAGPRPSAVSAITYSNGVSTVQFSTTVGNTYSIAYTNTLGGALSTWPVDSPTLVGDGNTDTLNHTNSTDSQEFINIIAQ